NARLMVGEPPDASDRLEQADEEQVLDLRMHHAQIKLRGIEEALAHHRVVEEGVAEPIASGPDDRIEAVCRAVAEMHELAVEACDAAARGNGAVAECGEDRRIERGMHAGRVAFRLLETVLLPRPDRIRNRILQRARGSTASAAASHRVDRLADRTSPWAG